MIAVCDTGPLVAAVNRRDRHHALCRDALDGFVGALIVPVTVAVEVDYLLRSRVGIDAARAFLGDIDSGAFTLEPIGSDVFRRALEVDEQYADADLGLVDASVVAVSESRRASTVFTLDHADLRLALPPHVELVPSESDVSRP
jgi:predicted nucleic acid-binding protein